MSPQSKSEWLEDWLEEEFGVRNERLVTDPELADAVVGAHEDLYRRFTETAAAREEPYETYRQTIREAAELDEEDKEDRLRKLQEAKTAKKKYQIKCRDLDRLMLPLTAVLVVDALRAFDGIPEPGRELWDALRERFLVTQHNIRGVRVKKFKDRLEIVREALAFDLRLKLALEDIEIADSPGEYISQPLDEEITDDILDGEEIEIWGEREGYDPADEIAHAGDIDFSDIDE